MADYPGFNWKNLVLGFTAGHFAFESYLNYRQHIFLLNDKPDPKADDAAKESFVKAQTYQVAKSKFGMISSAYNLVLNVATIQFNVLPKMFAAAGTFLAKYAPKWFIGSLPQSIALFLGMQVLSSILSLPLRYYSTFVLEEKFGFNKQTKSLFVIDFFKEQLLSIAIGGPVMVGFVKIIEYFGDSFFVYMLGAFLALQVFMMSIAPSLIMPLFNKFTPLPEGTLKTRIENLASQVHFPLSQLFLIDGSKRSSHSNAFFTGMPWSKRIVLFDTLVESSSEDEIVAVIAHEIGHWAKSHLSKTLLFSQANIAVIFLTFSAFFRNNSFYTSFGFPPMAQKPIIVGFMLFLDILKPIECVMSLLSSMLSRKHEFEADAYATDLNYGPDLCTALTVLAKENLSVQRADPLYSAYHHSHPLTPVRIETVQKLIADKEAAAKKEK